MRAAPKSWAKYTTEGQPLLKPTSGIFNVILVLSYMVTLLLVHSFLTALASCYIDPQTNTITPFQGRKIWPVLGCWALQSLVKICFFNAFCTKKLKKQRKSKKIGAKFGKKMCFEIAPECWSIVQWLQKVCLHKEGAAWTDAQTVTHFRNALRNKVVDWYDTLECFGVDTANKNWNEIITS